MNLNGTAEEGTNLWSSILDSVQTGSRRVQTKNIVILGEYYTTLLLVQLREREKRVNSDVDDFVVAR